MKNWLFLSSYKMRFCVSTGYICFLVKTYSYTIIFLYYLLYTTTWWHLRCYVSHILFIRIINLSLQKLLTWVYFMEEDFFVNTGNYSFENCTIINSFGWFYIIRSLPHETGLLTAVLMKTPSFWQKPTASIRGVQKGRHLLNYRLK